MRRTQCEVVLLRGGGPLMPSWELAWRPSRVLPVGLQVVRLSFVVVVFVDLQAVRSGFPAFQLSFLVVEVWGLWAVWSAGLLSAASVRPRRRCCSLPGVHSGVRWVRFVGCVLGRLV